MKTLYENSLMNNQVLNYFLAELKAIELRCLDESIKLPTLTPLSKENPISASQIKNWLYQYQGNLHYLLFLLLHSSSVTAAHNLGALVFLKHLSEKVEKLKSDVQYLISSSELSFGLLDTFSEDFTTYNNTEAEYQDMVDIDRRGLAPSFGQTYLFYNDEIISTYVSKGAFVVHDVPISNINRRRHDIFAKQVYQQTAYLVAVDLKVYTPTDEEYKYIEIRTPVNNGIESIGITAILKNGSRETIMDASPQGDSATINAEASGPVESFSVRLVSSIPDGNDSLGVYHIFMVDQISTSVLPPSAGRTYISKPIPFDNSFQTAALRARLGGPSEFRPKIYLSALDNKTKWTNWNLIRPNGEQQVRFGTVDHVTNTLDKSEMTLQPYTSSKIATLNWTLSNTFVPSINSFTYSNETYTLDLSSLVMLRDASSASIRSSNGSNPGWTFEDDTWTTHFFTTTIRSVDFGSSRVVLDGVVVNGRIEIPPGLHTLSTIPDYWVKVDSGLSVVNFKKRDSLFPYNVRYIISGYPEVDEYPGLGTHGSYIGRFVAPDVIKYEEFNQEYFSLELDGSSRRVIIPIEPDTASFDQELIAIWGNRISNQETFSKIKTKIEFPDTNVLGAYVKSYSVMVN